MARPTVDDVRPVPGAVEDGALQSQRVQAELVDWGVDPAVLSEHDSRSTLAEPLQSQQTQLLNLQSLARAEGD